MVVPMHGNAVHGSPDGGNMPNDDQIAYTVKRAAQVLDLGERTMWQLVQDEEIESIKIGRSRRIPRAALVAYVNQLRAEAGK